MTRRLVSLLSLLLLMASCQALSSTWHSQDRRVARIGMDVLYESEIASLLPPGTSPADSAQMVRQYIDTWALSKLLLLKAKEELSKSDRDISDQMEELRRSILGFRYEKLYVENNLDTVVSVKELEDYYNEHSRNYVFSYSVVKARFVRISSVSPYYETIKAGFRIDNPTSNAELAELCKGVAEKYSQFGGEWISAGVLAGEIGRSSEDCEKDLASGSFFEYEEGDSRVLVYIFERVAPGEVSPFAFNKARIQETVISKRKQELISKLERELLSEAIGNKKLKIYDYNE